MSRCRTLAVALVAPSAPPCPYSRPQPTRAASRSATATSDPASQGRDVRVLQDFLTRVGIATPVDGQYGPLTARRVKSWERRSRPARQRPRLAGRRARAAPPGRRRASRSTRRPPAAGPGRRSPTPASTRSSAPTARRSRRSRRPRPSRRSSPPATAIVGKPYKYGGGHGRWEDSGYDCSGSMSYALHGGGLLNPTARTTPRSSRATATPARASGSPPTRSGGHSYMVVAGLRFDTGYNNAGRGPALEHDDAAGGRLHRPPSRGPLAARSLVRRRRLAVAHDRALARRPGAPRRGRTARSAGRRSPTIIRMIPMVEISSPEMSALTAK